MPLDSEPVEEVLTSRDLAADIEEWISKDRKWEMLSDWQNYLLASRQAYFADRQNSLGSEYFSNAHDWDMIFEREWAIIQERMNAGIGVDADIMEMYGKDFFKDRESLMAELREFIPQQEVEDEEGNSLTIYTFEDFVMLSNQGIFRDEIFLIDPQRKWRKKVEDILAQYGYTDIQRMNIKGENYLVVTRG